MTKTLDQISSKKAPIGECLYVTGMNAKAREIVEALRDHITIEEDGTDGMFLYVRGKAITLTGESPDILPDLTCPNIRMRGEQGVKVYRLVAQKPLPDALRGEQLFLLAGKNRALLTTEIPLERLLEGDSGGVA